jgi:F-type H+-transporting ATPase subunit b
MLSLFTRCQPVLLSRTLFTSSHLISAVPATSVKKSIVAVKPEETLALLEQSQKASLARAISGVKVFDTMVQEKTKLWKEMHDVYYGKERDFDKFPVPKIPEYHPKVRMGCIPDSFFQAFYNKTGVTGPYLFLFGGLTYLLSKEIIIVDHEFDEVLLFFGYVFVVTKLLGPKIAAFLDKRIEAKNKALYRAPVLSLQEQADSMIKMVDEQIRNEEGITHLFQAKRDNVDLQLELAYRTRVDQVHKAVKARLDYQVEKEITRRHFQQQHMVNWIVNNVVKDIGAQQEKEILSQCIKDLQSIAKRQAQVAV